MSTDDRVPTTHRRAPAAADGARGTGRGRRPTPQVLARRWAVLGAAVVLVVFGVRAVVGAGPSKPAAVRAGTNAVTVATSRSSATTRALAVSLAPWHLGAAVSRAVVVPDGSDLAILGGLATGDTSTADIWRLDPRTGSDVRVATLPAAVHDAAGALVGRRAVVFGGGSYSTVAEVQAWSPGATSGVVAGSLPVPRSDLSAANLAGVTYIAGGYDGSALLPAILETSDGVQFRQVGRLVQPVRYGAMAAVDGAIWIVGGDLGTGESTSAASQTNDVQRFDPRTGVTKVVGHLPVTLGHASAVVLGGQLFVLGGRTGAMLSDRIWRVDTATGAVSVVGTLRYPRSDAGVAVSGDTAWLVGGETVGPTAPLDTVLELRLVTHARRT